MNTDKEKIIAALRQMADVVKQYGDSIIAVTEDDFEETAELILSLVKPTE
jgi:hypothetical protein